MNVRSCRTWTFGVGGCDARSSPNQGDPPSIKLFTQIRYGKLCTLITTGAADIRKNRCLSGVRKGMRISRGGRGRKNNMDMDAFLRREKT